MKFTISAKNYPSIYTALIIAIASDGGSPRVAYTFTRENFGESNYPVNIRNLADIEVQLGALKPNQLARFAQVDMPPVIKRVPKPLKKANEFLDELFSLVQ